MEVIFMAYANSQGNPLPLLKKEFDDVYAVLTDNQVHENYSIHRDSSPTISSINKFLGTFSGDIGIFSYSGHAGEEHVLLDDNLSNAEGIVEQLKSSVDSGSLKLVFLNGCSTVGQVKKLQEIGVPVVVATSAPVNDQSASEFAVRFYSNLFEKQLSFRKAFDDAMGPAKSGTGVNLNTMRHIDIRPLNNKEPLWGIYGEEDLLDQNPFIKTEEDDDDDNFFPNAKLLGHLYDVFNKAGNPETLELQKKEAEGTIVEDHEKRDKILFSVPFPIATNLLNMLNTMSAARYEKNKDKFFLKWLEEVGQLYHVSSEFMGLIMIAQLWEAKLRFNEINITSELQTLLKGFFYLSAEERTVYNYIPFIETIRAFLQAQPRGNGLGEFVEEQSILKDLLLEGSDFASACAYLLKLHRDITLKRTIQNLHKQCKRAEENLCVFFSKLGFLYRYHLTSITQIDILKYRHLPSNRAQYKHQIIKLMRPLKSDEEQTFFQYFMPKFIDNWTVVLIKNKKEKVRNAMLKEIEVEDLDFLNLSPFVIDRLVFEDKRDKSNVMFFNRYLNKSDIYEFSDVSCPMKTNDFFKVEKFDVANKKKYELESIRLQFKAFREEVLGEQLS